MANVLRSAAGKQVNMEALRIANETVLAVGNMKVNARGDEIGPGGKVLKSKAQLLKDYHKLNTPVIDQSTEKKTPPPENIKSQLANTTKLKGTVVNASTVKTEEQNQNNTESVYVKPRGSFAEAVAEQTEVNQELLNPTGLNGSLGNEPKGVQRI